MYEVVQSFRSRAYGDLSTGDELTESQYQMLSTSEKEKVKRRLNNRKENDDRDYRAGADYTPYTNSWGNDDSPSESSHTSSFGGFESGSSGGGGSSDSWSDGGGSDSGGSDGGGGD